MSETGKIPNGLSTVDKGNSAMGARDGQGTIERIENLFLLFPGGVCDDNFSPFFCCQRLDDPVITPVDGESCKSQRGFS